MKYSHFLLALASAVCLTFTACKKNNEDNPAPNTSVNDFFEKHEVKAQSFTINVDDASATITGDKGTLVTFPKSVFRTQEGANVSGAISIKLTEIYDQSDMILSNRPTTSEGELLESGGEISISAFQNGEKLLLAHGKNILVQFATENDNTDMKLFTGALEDGMFNWTYLPTRTSQTPIEEATWSTDSVSTFYYDESRYLFSVAKIGWINCDRFYNASNKTTVDVTATNRGTIDNTAAFLVYKDINSVGRFAEHSSQGVWRSGSIPIGQEATVVVISLKDGKQYFGTKEITVAEGLSVNVDLHEATEDDIINTLESFN